ncbi:MAG: type III pantothenate kinase [Cytophagales bacterium]|nr:type III pantothenate kinase [Cytophagales bacterium]
MNVCVDIGNTRAKLGFFEGTQLKASEAATFEEIASRINKAKPDAVLLSSVSRDLREVCRQLSPNVYSMTMSAETVLPIEIDYHTPHTLGADRIAAAAGVWDLNPGCASLAIDLGTCITYDFIDSAGVYHGGGISPGFRMRLKSLNSFTEKLPFVEPVPDPVLIGKTTEESILSGVCQGIQLEIEGFIREYRKKFGDLKVFLCGGDSYRINRQHLKGVFEEPELVLKGLNAILRYNVEKTTNFFDH